MTRALIAPVVFFALLGAGPPQLGTDLPAYQAPAKPWESVEHAEREKACRDRIEQVREAAGKPKLDRAPASPDRSMLMYAVDTRIDNCGVIVPVADPTDLRQAPPPGIAQLIPAIPG